MNTNSEELSSKTCWFVGAMWDSSDDQAERFLKDGIWQNGYQDKYLDLVKSVQPGDRIAIKAAYSRKKNVPFDNRGHSVAVMAIKAIGIVKKNHGDGRMLDVEWKTSFVDPPKEWYFYTSRQTIWRVSPGNWKKDGLIDFAFNDKPQDIDRFRNAPYWRERFGDISVDKDKDTTAPQDGSGSDVQGDELNNEPEEENIVTPIEPYSVDNIISDGCFLELSEIERMLNRLREKKNLILQGSPGTGKTWLARKLAFALIEQKDGNRVRVVQFHPNLSYEDFVRGWRPSGDGKLTLTDGPFMEMISAAKKDPQMGHVIVIEEINRGNPAQIFGEMLTLLEADKRTPDEALELSYRRGDDERVFIPSNLYVIGTMNIADRSIALVDLALRRRFAFINLKPEIGEKWKQWVHTNYKIDVGILEKIKERILSLNHKITDDPSLGEQFCIGHSFVTPTFDIQFDDDRAKEWFRQVVNTEIVPLLEEYWFDSLDKVRNAGEDLRRVFEQ